MHAFTAALELGRNVLTVLSIQYRYECFFYYSKTFS
jgi:hypothetical protein